jgi:hypothetical protein
MGVRGYSASGLSGLVDSGGGSSFNFTAKRASLLSGMLVEKLENLRLYDRHDREVRRFRHFQVMRIQPIFLRGLHHIARTGNGNFVISVAVTDHDWHRFQAVERKAFGPGRGSARRNGSPLFVVFFTQIPSARAARGMSKETNPVRVDGIFLGNQFENVQGVLFAQLALFQTGRPFTTTESGNISLTSQNADRPNAIAGYNPNNGPKTVSQWMNTSCFTLPTTGTFGNVGRNTLIGPRMVTLDMAIARVFTINERMHLQFRGEAFNTANHPNFQQPNATQNGSTFGKIAATLVDNREIQLAMKLIF